MTFVDEDWEYLVIAYQRGGACTVENPVHRASLAKVGLMTPAKATRASRYGGTEAFCMALTKKGAKRAQEILRQKQFEPQISWEKKLRQRVMQKLPAAYRGHRRKRA